MYTSPYHKIEKRNQQLSSQQSSFVVSHACYQPQVSNNMVMDMQSKEYSNSIFTCQQLPNFRHPHFVPTRSPINYDHANKLVSSYEYNYLYPISHSKKSISPFANNPNLAYPYHYPCFNFYTTQIQEQSLQQNQLQAPLNYLQKQQHFCRQYTQQYPCIGSQQAPAYLPLEPTLPCSGQPQIYGLWQGQHLIGKNKGDPFYYGYQRGSGQGGEHIKQGQGLWQGQAPYGKGKGDPFYYGYQRGSGQGGEHIKQGQGQGLWQGQALNGKGKGDSFYYGYQCGSGQCRENIKQGQGQGLWQGQDLIGKDNGDQFYYGYYRGLFGGERIKQQKDEEVREEKVLEVLKQNGNCMELHKLMLILGAKKASPFGIAKLNKMVTECKFTSIRGGFIFITNQKTRNQNKLKKDVGQVAKVNEVEHIDDVHIQSVNLNVFVKQKENKLNSKTEQC